MKNKCNDRIIPGVIHTDGFFFSAIHTKMQGYVLFTAPAIFIITALFTLSLIKNIRNTSQKPFKIFLTLLLLSVFVLAFRYGMERVKPFQTKEMALAIKNEIQQQNFTKKEVLFNVPCAIETMFYSACTAYEKIPTQAEIDTLLSTGYQINIRKTQNLPAYILENKNLRLLDLPAMEKY